MVGSTQIRGGLATLAALSTAAAVHAGNPPTPIYVDDSAPAGGNGSSWAQAFNDLQDALEVAKIDPSPIKRYDIRIAQGIYTPDRGTGDQSMSFQVASSVTLTGGYAGFGAAEPDLRDPSLFVSVLSGDLNGDDVPPLWDSSDNSRSVVRAQFKINPPVLTPTVLLNGLTVRGAYGGQLGGGVSLDVEGMPIICSDCTIERNYATRGGGIGSTGVLRLVRCVIRSNEAFLGGGGIYTDQSLEIVDSMITSNRTFAYEGGGVYCGPLRADRTVIADNTAYSGAGVALRGGRLSSCIVAGNNAQSSQFFGPGGGILNLGGGLAVTRCLIADNTADTGAAIGRPATTEYSTTLDMQNCTVVANRGMQEAGAIKVFATCRIVNSVFAHNTAAEGTPSVVAQGNFTSRNNLIREGTSALQGSSLTLVGTHLSGDPRFVNVPFPLGPAAEWRTRDYRLLAGSPGVDAADAFGSPAASGFDLEGRRVPVNILVAPDTGAGPVTYLDLGAYETQPACAADFDGSGQPVIDDLFWFLNLYFVADPLANVDGLGDVTVDDLFTFLNAWFRGC